MTERTWKTAEEIRAQRQKERFQENAAKLTAAVILLPIHAWILMLVLGAVHSIALAVPAVGYGTAFLFVLGFDLVAATSKKFRK